MAEKLDDRTIEMIESKGQYVIDIDKEKDPNEISESDIPQYRRKIELTAEEIERLTKQVTTEFKALREERKELKLAEEWASRDNQYNGDLKPNKKLHFNLHSHQSKIKEDAIVRAINAATLESDPIIDVSPRPEYEKEGGKEVCDAQAQFLDYEMDENIKPNHQFVLINHDAVRKYVGIGKIEWAYRKERRKREEQYNGEWTPKVDDKKQPIVGQDGQVQLENKALEEFMSNYPDAEKRYPAIVKQIAKGEKVALVVEYFDVIENNAKIRYVAIEDFWVCNSCQGNWGLKDTHLVVERQQMRWNELEEKQENDEFENVNELADMKEDSEGLEHTTKDYTVYEMTTYFKRDDEDEEIKIKCWFGDKAAQDGGDSEGSLVYLGSIFYPYFGFDIDYIAFYIKKNNDGFYGKARSVALDLRDSNIAQDAILNLALHSAYVRNILTPIVKEGSEIEAQFIENRWTDGKPLSVDQMTDKVSDAVGFLQYPQVDMNQLLAMDNVLKRIDSDVSGVSDLMTGRESPSDPRAPATKTMALLNQSGVNVKDYITIYIHSFNILMSNLLALYYQMSREERKFRVNERSSQVTGGNPFSGIKRDMMVARTTIQSRAASFAFDKINEKNENMAAFQLLSTSPYAMTQPAVQFEALKLLMRSWSPAWKNLSDTLLSPQDFDKKMVEASMVALQKLQQASQMQAQATGIPPQPPQMGQMAEAVKQEQAVAFNPALAQEKK